MSSRAQNMETRTHVLDTAEMSLRAQNLKTEPDTLGNAENEFRITKHEVGLSASVPSKMCVGSQNIMTETGCLPLKYFKS
jgi:hypothetical protein